MKLNLVYAVYTFLLICTRTVGQNFYNDLGIDCIKIIDTVTIKNAYLLNFWECEEYINQDNKKIEILCKSRSLITNTSNKDTIIIKRMTVNDAYPDFGFINPDISFISWECNVRIGDSLYRIVDDDSTYEQSKKMTIDGTAKMQVYKFIDEYMKFYIALIPIKFINMNYRRIDIAGEGPVLVLIPKKSVHFDALKKRKE